MEEGREDGQGRGLAVGLQIVDDACVMDASELGTVPVIERWFPAARNPWVWWLIAVLAGGASAFGLFSAFPPLNLAEAAYVWAIPLIAWILVVQPTCRQVAIIAFASGLGSWFASIFWLRHFTATTGLPAPLLIGTSLTFLLSAVLGLFLMVWALALNWVFPRTWGLPKPHRLIALLGLAGLWVVLEWVRGWILTGFPWLPLAASQWERPMLLQMASVTGAWGISFLLVFFNFAIVFYVVQFVTQERGRWYTRLNPEFYTAMCLLVLAVFAGLHLGGQRGEAVEAFSVGFVQPNVAPSEKWEATHARNVLEDLARLSRMSTYLDADVILWPEAPTPYPVLGNAMMQQWVEDLASSLDRVILMGNIAVVGEETDDAAQWFNSVFVVHPDLGLRPQYYSKRRLVPFGEYIPFTGLMPFLDKVVPLPGVFHPGREVQVLPLDVQGSVFRIGSLICFEDIFSSLARESVKAGADILFVATNNAWFGEEAGAYQHAAHSVLRAVETRRPVIRVGNAGWSGWIDEYGGIRHVMTGPTGSVYFQGTQVATIGRSPYLAGKLTPYVRFGDWFVGLCGLLTLTGFLLLRSRKPMRPSSQRMTKMLPPKRPRLGEGNRRI